MIDLRRIVGFDWDDANRFKSRDKHGVTVEEIQQVFEDESAMFLKDVRHSQAEPHFQALGRTKKLRYLTVIFTLRSDNTLLRVISARDMDRKERACYD